MIFFEDDVRNPRIIFPTNTKIFIDNIYILFIFFVLFKFWFRSLGQYIKRTGPGKYLEKSDEVKR
jgi:hypothetical protein